MCGFSAYFHFDANYRDGKFPKFDLDGSLKNLHHRGPDSQGQYISPCGRCGLGHARLSIIDLEGGHQPLSSKQGDLHMVVNGELYDFERIMDELKSRGHEFKTRSDSEIALHLYEEEGISFLEYLRGEFAICLWDSKRSQLIVARDRFGIKPVYYTVRNGTLLVASEVKAFLPMGWEPEWDVDSILHDGATFDYRTCFKDVYKLPPAHYLRATASGSLEVRQYWDADYPDKTLKETRSVDEMVQGVRERLVDAVRQRLRADVPLGVYLSGGIDSACVAGIATHLLREKDPNARIDAFSISFVSGDDHYDEGDIAERTAEFCNAKFHKLAVTEEDLLSSFEESIWHVEQPQFNLNGVGKFLLSKYVRDQGFKVVMTGEGSDEHFAGYSLFHTDYLREADLTSPDGFGTLPDDIRHKLFEEISQTKKADGSTIIPTATDASTKNNVARQMVNNVSCHVLMQDLLSIPSEMYTDEVRSKHGEVIPGLAIAEAVSGVARHKAKTKWHPLHTALYLESRTFLGNFLCNILGDRCEMAHSIEARTPFMDHPLCEYVNSLPPSVKIRASEDGTLNEKWILKEAVQPFITDEIYKRTKHPYVAPPSKGKDLPIINLMDRLLTEENINQLGWANWSTVKNYKDTFRELADSKVFKDLLIMMSYVVLSQRFNVRRYNHESPM
ncbi:uncharacterized protein BYT42DRAFT_530779 [Radiomyces spectabilis]|uniref:uncharacterized protein n=1 Tax=Radiomyces spectabilis TaxID=64574 RepID=UPI00221E71D3|nr:uncharacterized protein BYT42DRAFT_530779 [Radiomyces spectabilis]KAI8381106.1 hypothetical protein BYT42DRAFT_530779 [Radiomyces spectabilis]